jgi:hypothetical protein
VYVAEAAGEIRRVVLEVSNLFQSCLSSQHISRRSPRFAAVVK